MPALKTAITVSSKTHCPHHRLRWLLLTKPWIRWIHYLSYSYLWNKIFQWTILVISASSGAPYHLISPEFWEQNNFKPAGREHSLYPAKTLSQAYLASWHSFGHGNKSVWKVEWASCLTDCLSAIPWQLPPFMASCRPHSIMMTCKFNSYRRQTKSTQVLAPCQLKCSCSSTLPLTNLGRKISHGHLVGKLHTPNRNPLKFSLLSSADIIIYHAMTCQCLSRCTCPQQKHERNLFKLHFTIWS